MVTAAYPYIRTGKKREGKMKISYRKEVKL